MCQDKTEYEVFNASFEIIPLSCNVYSSDLDPYDSIWLKLLTILFYSIEVIASIGGFQLLDLIITELKSHMTC